MKAEIIEGKIVGNIYKDEQSKEDTNDGIRNRRNDNSTTN